jgi:hypothetical protein
MPLIVAALFGFGAFYGRVKTTDTLPPASVVKDEGKVPSDWLMSMNLMTNAYAYACPGLIVSLIPLLALDGLTSSVRSYPAIRSLTSEIHPFWTSRT